MPEASFSNCHNQNVSRHCHMFPQRQNHPGCTAGLVTYQEWASQVGSKNPSKVSGYKSPAQGYLLHKAMKNIHLIYFKSTAFQGRRMNWGNNLRACSLWLLIAAWWNGKIFWSSSIDYRCWQEPLFLVKHCNWSAAFFPWIFITSPVKHTRHCSNPRGLCLQRAL